MRIAFVTNPHYPDGIHALRSLVEHGFDVVAVITPTQRRPGKGRLATIHTMVSQYGVRGFAEKAMAGARFILRSRVRSDVASVESFARDHGISVYTPARLSSRSFRADLAALDLDLIVVTFCSQVFPARVLTLPRIGCINVHRSLLPRYRGPQPIFWAMLRGETSTGATVHWLVKDIDAGAIVAQREIPIHPWDLEQDVAERAAEAGAEALIDAMGRIERGERGGRAPDLEHGSHFSRPGPAELARFRALIARRRRLRESSASAALQACKVRGLTEGARRPREAGAGVPIEGCRDAPGDPPPSPRGRRLSRRRSRAGAQDRWELRRVRSPR